MDDIKYIIKLLEDQGSKIADIEKILKSQQSDISKPLDIKDKKLKSDKNTEYSGLTKGIYVLIEESFFNNPKELNQIETQLKANAIFYPITSYPKSLLRLITDKHLRRIKENNKWKYVKY